MRGARVATAGSSNGSRKMSSWASRERAEAAGDHDDLVVVDLGERTGHRGVLRVLRELRGEAGAATAATSLAPQTNGSDPATWTATCLAGLLRCLGARAARARWSRRAGRPGRRAAGAETAARPSASSTSRTGMARPHRLARGIRPRASTGRCTARPSSARADSDEPGAPTVTTRAPRRIASSSADRVSSVSPEQETATTRSIAADPAGQPVAAAGASDGDRAAAPGDRGGHVRGDAGAAHAGDDDGPRPAVRGDPRDELLVDVQERPRAPGRRPWRPRAASRRRRAARAPRGRRGPSRPSAVRRAPVRPPAGGAAGRGRASSISSTGMSSRTGRPGRRWPTCRPAPAPASSTRSAAWQLRAGQDLQQAGVELHGGGLLGLVGSVGRDRDRDGWTATPRGFPLRRDRGWTGGPVAADHGEHVVAQRLHRRAVRGLDVEPEQRLGVGRAQVEPPGRRLDGHAVEVVDLDAGQGRVARRGPRRSRRPGRRPRC